MTRISRASAAVAAAALTAATMVGTSIQASATEPAEPCASGADVRAQVHALVAGLQDDINSRSTRAHLAAALVDTLHTFRGAKAATAEERRELGLQIATLAKQLQEAQGLVARKAIVADILALTEQREAGRFTADERAQLNAAIAALENAVIAKTDTGVEGREVAEAFSSLHEQFTCSPS
jgi:hypothetical protein